MGQEEMQQACLSTELHGEDNSEEACAWPHACSGPPPSAPSISGVAKLAEGFVI